MLSASTMSKPRPEVEEDMSPAVVRRELRQLIRLALPVMVTSCSTMSMTLTDQVWFDDNGVSSLMTSIAVRNSIAVRSGEKENVAMLAALHY